MHVECKGGVRAGEMVGGGENAPPVGQEVKKRTATWREKLKVVRGKKTKSKGQLTVQKQNKGGVQGVKSKDIASFFAVSQQRRNVKPTAQHDNDEVRDGGGNVSVAEMGRGVGTAEAVRSLAEASDAHQHMRTRYSNGDVIHEEDEHIKSRVVWASPVLGASGKSLARLASSDVGELRKLLAGIDDSDAEDTGERGADVHGASWREPIVIGSEDTPVMAATTTTTAAAATNGSAPVDNVDLMLDSSVLLHAKTAKPRRSASGDKLFAHGNGVGAYTSSTLDRRKRARAIDATGAGVSRVAPSAATMMTQTVGTATAFAEATAEPHLCRDVLDAFGRVQEELQKVAPASAPADASLKEDDAREKRGGGARAAASDVDTKNNDAYCTEDDLEALLCLLENEGDHIEKRMEKREDAQITQVDDPHGLDHNTPSPQTVVGVVDMDDGSREVHVRLRRKANSGDGDRDRNVMHASPREGVVVLRDQWAYTDVSEGDTVFVLGAFFTDASTGRNLCVIGSGMGNFIVVYPEVIISGTRVSGSFDCLRRAYLDERIPSSAGRVALEGTLLHEIFQYAVSEFPGPSSSSSSTFGDDIAILRTAITNFAMRLVRTTADKIYEVGVSDAEMFESLAEHFSSIETWALRYRSREGARVSGVEAESRGVTTAVTEIVDIEENIWAPHFGIKGQIDVTVRATMGGHPHASIANHGSASESAALVPLELKTGFKQHHVAHRSQVLMYALLISERYSRAVAGGLLVYLRQAQTDLVPYKVDEMEAIIRQRNLLATALAARPGASLPETLGAGGGGYGVPHLCKKCGQALSCSLFARYVRMFVCPSVRIGCNHAVSHTQVSETRSLVSLSLCVCVCAVIHEDHIPRSLSLIMYVCVSECTGHKRMRTTLASDLPLASLS